jgi:hypothetical protein
MRNVIEAGIEEIKKEGLQNYFHHLSSFIPDAIEERDL